MYRVINIVFFHMSSLVILPSPVDIDMVLSLTVTFVFFPTFLILIVASIIMGTSNLKGTDSKICRFVN